MSYHASVCEDEAKALLVVEKVAKKYGYGNVIAHLKALWIEELEDQGIRAETAIAAVDVSPYPRGGRPGMESLR